MNRKYVSEEAGSYFRVGVKRQYKVCNFGLKQKPAGHSSKPVGFPFVFSGRRSNTHKGTPPQKKDTSHKRHRRRIEI